MIASKAASFSLALALVASPAFGDVKITNVCDGARPARQGTDILIVCPNGRQQVRIVGLCKGGVLRAYYGRNEENYLVCNSTVNPLVIALPLPQQVFQVR